MLLHQHHRRRWIESFAVLMALAGLYAFAASFFLSKHSLPLHRSECDKDAPELLRLMGLSEPAVRKLQAMKLIPTSDDDSSSSSRRNGCWMDRRADAVIILLVDALRIDFARQLTRSVQARLAAVSSDPTNSTVSSRLFRFVADPPTVTTQRIKALTTGGLPTFADISTNFGGASVEDDNWLFQLQTCEVHKRGYNTKEGTGARIGFVGDDTWIDLYPHSFYEPHPYPSFNTRDIHTVDNGCVHHLPALLDHLRPHPQQNLELAIVHFLGVDHVGHTYGPTNEHMDAKLSQMDETLDYVLTYLDNNDPERSCKIVLIFGDHGMTSDGNHGGGTIEEVSAGLFAHATPSCGGFLLRENSHNQGEEDVPSIHQIDLVPTLSFLLGIPIPFANLGRVVPSLLPPMPSPKQDQADQEGESAASPSASATTAVALALNAGQVWRYLNTYRQAFGGQLQGLEIKLLSHLQRAVTLLENAIDVSASTKEENHDAAWKEASEAFGDFLGRALELGQQAWTQFDIPGMVAGILILTAAIVMFAIVSYGTRSTTAAATRSSVASSNQESNASLGVATTAVEVALAGTFVLYHCGILTFSNSYILEEQRSLQFATGALCCAVALRFTNAPAASTKPNDKARPSPPPIQPLWMWALLIPVASRLHELLVSGHGLDPSIRLHSAHSPAMFLPCLVLLLLARWNLHRRRIVVSIPHWIGDGVSLAALGVGWVEKRRTDQSRTGFAACRIALALAGIGLLYSLFRFRTKAATEVHIHRHTCLAVLCKLLVVLMAVTGPSTAATMVMYIVQVAALVQVSPHVSGIVTATLVKLITRHAFFATNHACFFNRLQYSAAFVATTEFNFVAGGLSLFLNTFGWELAGMLVCFALQRRHVWTCYVSMQLVEALCSCVSVSLLRRHLMVWDIYAPHFLFSSIFTILTCLSHVTASIISVW
jgi:GPI ethanolamine phosphate transferase 3 subunit O